MPDLGFSLCNIILEVLYIYMTYINIYFPSCYVCMWCEHVNVLLQLCEVTAVPAQSSTENCIRVSCTRVPFLLCNCALTLFSTSIFFSLKSSYVTLKVRLIVN